MEGEATLNDSKPGEFGNKPFAFPVFENLRPTLRHQPGDVDTDYFGLFGSDGDVGRATIDTAGVPEPHVYPMVVRIESHGC